MTKQERGFTLKMCNKVTVGQWHHHFDSFPPKYKALCNLSLLSEEHGTVLDSPRMGRWVDPKLQRQWRTKRQSKVLQVQPQASSGACSL